jgi:hypothetical protein
LYFRSLIILNLKNRDIKNGKKYKNSETCERQFHCENPLRLELDAFAPELYLTKKFREFRTSNNKKSKNNIWG